jgi:hypothetical protein
MTETLALGRTQRLPTPVLRDEVARQHIAGLKQQLAGVQKRLPAEVSADERPKFSAIQQKWEQIAQAFGDSEGTPRWLNGESVADYDRRLMGKYKAHSKAWKNVDLVNVHDSMLEIAGSQIRAHALAAAIAPPPSNSGQLAMREFKDPAGRSVRHFYGDTAITWAPFTNPRRYVIKFNEPRRSLNTYSARSS